MSRWLDKVDPMTLKPILDHLTSIGCTQPEINLLQPADPFLDTTGEDLRRRIFMTQDNGGKSLCLRPEFTVPVCLHHLERGNGPVRYAYGGSVFRQRTDAPSEFLQAGFEDLGRNDVELADVECIGVAAELLRSMGQAKSNLVVGHQAVFVSVLRALDLPPVLRKKLLRAFGDTMLLQEVIDQLSEDSAQKHVVLPEQITETLEAEDQESLVREVKDLMLADGLPLTGSRTPEAIAMRLMEKHELGSVQLGQEKKAILESFLAIDVPLKQTADTLKDFARQNELVMADAIEPVEMLASGLSHLEIDGSYRASFGRRLDYYTGIVFEFYKNGGKKPVIGGGRYDQLMSLLGAKEEIPAVGFAVWIERLGGRP